MNALDTTATPSPAPAPVRSSWIAAVAYRHGFLALFLRDRPEALLYGPDVPAYVPGLLAAGCGGRKGAGTVYNRVLKGRHAYQRVTGAAVDQLKEMMS